LNLDLVDPSLIGPNELDQDETDEQDGSNPAGDLAAGGDMSIEEEPDDEDTAEGLLGGTLRSEDRGAQDGSCTVHVCMTCELSPTASDDDKPLLGKKAALVTVPGLPVRSDDSDTPWAQSGSALGHIVDPRDIILATQRRRGPHPMSLPTGHSIQRPRARWRETRPHRASSIKVRAARCQLPDLPRRLCIACSLHTLGGELWW
jgi:hypothetical protein